MKIATLASLLMLSSLSAVADETEVGRLRPSDEVIRKAVRETLAESPGGALKDRGPALRGERYESFSRKFDEARKPFCWGPDGLKHQPARIGPIGLGGILALPFLGAAIVRGKCTQ